MPLRIWLTTAVIFAGTIGGAAYVYNNITIHVSPALPPAVIDDTTQRDFRDRIPDYDTLTNAEKRYAISELISELRGHEREQAGKELVTLSRETIADHTKTHGGHVPPGWE